MVILPEEPVWSVSLSFSKTLRPTKQALILANTLISVSWTREDVFHLGWIAPDARSGDYEGRLVIFQPFVDLFGIVLWAAAGNW